MYKLHFSSMVAVSPGQAWQWATSPRGISTELWPIMKMTYPSWAGTLDLAGLPLGRRLFRAWILLFGIVPIDRSDLTVVELEPGRRFLERSPMLTMRLWQHERLVDGAGQHARITDRLTFTPRFAGRLVAWFIARVFRHRHAVLRRQLTA